MEWRILCGATPPTGGMDTRTLGKQASRMGVDTRQVEALEDWDRFCFRVWNSKGYTFMRIALAIFV